MLTIRKELGLKAAVSATAKHGDRLDLVETRRRFAKVRTSSGAEGWTEMNQLLSDRQMADLNRLATGTAGLPSEGTAKAYSPLNVHVEPFRQSPAFYQIPENGTVEVLAHRLAPHAPPAPPQKPHVHRTAAKKSRAKPAAPPLIPLPSPPGPPKNWLELSRSVQNDPPAPVPKPDPPPSEDWYLVRTRNGGTGWALAHMLAMAIPEEVGQYAEGHRVTSYLGLGQVQDKDRGETKQNWLWTTVSSGVHPYDFDSFRVFVWSTKHHRYETAYIERNVKGYYPVEAKASSDPGDNAFSLVLEDSDGKRYTHAFAFNGYHIRLVSKTPYEEPPALPEVHTATSFDAEPSASPAAPSGWRASGLPARVREWWAKFRAR